MSGQAQLSQDDVVEINPIYLLRWEESEQAYMLLYPEGIVKLNSSAGEILKRVGGGRSVRDIIEDLSQAFDGADVAADVLAFLEIANDKSWTRLKA